MVVERGGALDSEPKHDRKTGSIDEGEILVGPGLSNLPGSLDVCEPYGFKDDTAATQLGPEAFCGMPPDSVVNERPRLSEDVIGG
jgi:hypothetical protein